MAWKYFWEASYFLGRAILESMPILQKWFTWILSWVLYKSFFKKIKKKKSKESMAWKYFWEASYFLDRAILESMSILQKWFHGFFYKSVYLFSFKMPVIHRVTLMPLLRSYVNQ